MEATITLTLDAPDTYTTAILTAWLASLLDDLDDGPEIVGVWVDTKRGA